MAVMRRVAAAGAAPAAAAAADIRDRRDTANTRGVEREIATLKILNHPNVLKLYDVFETSRYLFLVSEYVEGGELYEYLKRHGFLDPREALIFFQKLIHAVDYCHSHYICHRDLKPENILLDSDLNLKLADFGFAAAMANGSLLSTSCGSPHYASPEVIMGVRYDGRAADVWSCGVILFALVTGQLPFDDDNVKLLLRKVKEGQFHIPSSVNRDIRHLIKLMLVVNPAERITIAQIKSHPWFLSNSQSGLYGLYPPLEDLGPPLTMPEIDDELFATLETLGLGTMPQLKEALCDPVPNQARSFYRLLEYRKLHPPECSDTVTTPRSSPSAERRTKEKLILPIIPPSTVSFRASPPSSLRGSGEGSPVDVPALCTSTSSPSRLHNDFPLGSPVISSSPARKALFTSAFHQPAKHHHRQLGFLSALSMEETIDEISRALSVIGAQWTINEARLIKAIYTTLEGATVKFTVELSSHPLKSNVAISVDFTYTSGDSDVYREMCHILSQELHLQ
ncbi:CAMK/CAMKL/BRSK protein kinase [Pelomyxa schiedti]|nr:CAMK/CAMKL/BRSK protein kinase [Pelomyxa schiedti]